MKIYNTKVGTTAYFTNRSWKPGAILFFRKEDIDCGYARLAEKTSESINYHTHPDRTTREKITGTMLTCISKPSAMAGRSVWMITDPKSEHLGKLIIFNGEWYSTHTNAEGKRVGFPTPTHYDLIENPL